MRILFMGTPDFAVASLRRLVEDGHEICGVFTQPDKPKNRGHKLAFSPVKEYALSQGLTVYQPVKLRDGTALELIRSLAPELTVVAAYGRILPEDILAVPKLGSINVHSSLLPKYAKFLAAGHKVKASIRFRGREMAHSALGADVLKRFAETLPQASMDKPPVLEGRTMSILLIPKPNKD